MRVCGDYGLHLTQNLSVGELPKNYAKIRAMAWGDYDNFLSNATGTGVMNLASPSSGNVMGGTTFTLTGGGKAMPNVSPCLSAYVWKRTA